MSGWKDWRVTMEVREWSSTRIFDSTFCIRDNNSVPLADPLGASTVAADLAAWLDNPWQTVSVVSLTVERLFVRELGTSTPEAADAGIGLPGTLAAGTNVLPYGVCAIASLKTSLATRSGRGRFHFPWPSGASYMTNGSSWNLAGAYYTNCNNVLTTLMAGTTVTHDTIAHDYSLRVWSTKLGESRDVNNALIRSSPGYIRSRATAP